MRKQGFRGCEFFRIEGECLLVDEERLSVGIGGFPVERELLPVGIRGLPVERELSPVD